MVNMRPWYGRHGGSIPPGSTNYGSRDGVAADPYKIGVTGFDSLTGYQVFAKVGA